MIGKVVLSSLTDPHVACLKPYAKAKKLIFKLYLDSSLVKGIQIAVLF